MMRVFFEGLKEVTGRTGFNGTLHGAMAEVVKGEFRPPRKGEWYLSGAIPAAYKAPNDLTTAYRIVTPGRF